jgi:integrase
VPLHRNPCDRRELPEVEEIEMVFLEHGEFAVLLRYTDLHYRPLLITLVGTGIRWARLPDCWSRTSTSLPAL